MLQKTPRRLLNATAPEGGTLSYFDSAEASPREHGALLVLVIASGRRSVRVPLGRHQVIATIKAMAEALS